MQTSLPTLYKKTKTGKVQQWAIVVDGDKFQTHEGLVGGAITASSPTTCVGKNVGRSNETTPEQQALKEAKAKWQKKVDAGYGENFVDASGARYVEPMLARVYEEEYPNDELEFPVYVQPKLDGVRCIATKDGLFSRKGKPFTSCDHIREALAPLFLADPDIILDGELYNHQCHDDFNRIVGAVKKQKPSAEQLAEIRQLIQYHVYDLPSAASLPFCIRYDKLSLLVSKVYGGPIHLVETDRVTTAEGLDASYQRYVKRNYEGQMIRLNKPYEFGSRSKYLLKQKVYTDAEFPIHDVIEGKGKRAGMMGRLAFLMNGKVFEAGCRGDDAFYRQLLVEKDRFIGQLATVRYQNLTPKGVPRCARMIALRDYE